jgi:hypothetical protein
MEIVPISHLGPSLWYPETRRIKAIVTLIWPYSSSTKSVALLLAEPDFRLRFKRGQVRVQFRGPSAAALARTKIGSGDEIFLHLDGVQWIEADPGITTPGKSIDTELLFKRRLVCQVGLVKKITIRQKNTVAEREIIHLDHSRWSRIRQS